MNHKKLLAFCILLFIPMLAMAKGEAAKYVVSKVSGRVEVIDAKGKRQVDKGDVLTGDVTLNVSFTGSITLLAEDGDKQYVINSPGKAKLDSFLADKGLCQVCCCPAAQRQDGEVASPQRSCHCYP